MTFDEKLAQALGESFDERMEQRMKVEKKHRFSLAYRLWEYRTLKNLKKKRYCKSWTIQRARLAVMAIIIASSLLAGASAYAVSLAVAKSNTDYSRRFFEGLSSDRTFIEDQYGLHTSDWDLMSSKLSDTELILKYEKYFDREKKLCMTQSIITDDICSRYSLNASAEPTDIFEKEDGLYISRGESSSLYWVNDGYLFELYGNIPKNEMIDLAISSKNTKLIFLD